MPLLVDTGILYALADRRDGWHKRCVAYLAKERERLLVPVTVLPEITYLLQTRLGPAAELTFVQAMAGREFDVEPLKETDLPRVSAFMRQYPDIGFVDATVVTMAERLKVPRIATIDRRHFGQIVPRHSAAFELVP